MTGQSFIFHFSDMNCDNFKILLSAYIDGEVDPKERVEVESHLMTCQSCSAELHELHRLKDLFRYLEVKEPALGFRSRLSAKLATAQQNLPFWYRIKAWTSEQLPRSLVYAFLWLILVIGGTSIFLKYQPMKPLVNTTQVQSSQLEELYAEDILFEPLHHSNQGEELISFNLEATPFDDLFEEPDLGG
jgi:negative regulator of sigma E activity